MILPNRVRKRVDLGPPEPFFLQTSDPIILCRNWLSHLCRWAFYYMDKTLVTSFCPETTATNEMKRGRGRSCNCASLQAASCSA
jgi:hypothetical protein